MEKFSRLITLFPCRHLEDFPVHLSEKSASSLHHAWTALWHPLLIHHCGSIPDWHPAEDTVSNDEEAEIQRQNRLQQIYYENTEDWAEGDELFDCEQFNNHWQGSLVAVAAHASDKIHAGFASAAAQAGATVVHCDDRNQFLDQIGIDSKVADDLVKGFFALGYVRLQVELMTRQLRFSSELDVEKFNDATRAAAFAAAESAGSSKETARAKLQAAFDLLIEERNRYYPVSAELLDVVLTHRGTRSEKITAEVNHRQATNILLHGETLQSIADTCPDLTRAIRDRVDSESLSVVGGEAGELPLGVMSIESGLNQLLVGREAFAKHLGVSPGVYMRRKSGLHHLTPRLLEGLGFAGAMHFTLDATKYPRSSSNCIRWNGIDGSSVMALGERALNAANDGSFLGLGPKIGTELDSTHTATVVFARWPGQSCTAYDDLKASCQFGNPLGDFVTAEACFREAYDPGYGDHFEADEYENAWPNQDIATAVTYWRRWYQLFSVRSLACQLALANSCDNTKIALLLEQGNQLQNKIESAAAGDSSADIDDELIRLTSDIKATTDGPASLFNPAVWTTQSHATVSGHSGPEFASRGKFRFAANSPRGWETVTKLNGMQTVALPGPSPPETTDLAKAPFVDNENRLQNESFEVRIDPQSGGIKGVAFYGKRGSLFGQQVSARLNGSGKARYGQNVCEKLETVRDSRIRSHITASGKLLDGSQTLASFQQTTTLSRGRKLIDVHVDIQPTDLGQKLLDSGGTFCLRTAWASEASSLACDSVGTRQDVRKPQINAAHFIEVIDADHRFALLCKGLPLHTRTERNKLETTLAARQCDADCSFDFAYAIDVPNIMQTAISESVPPIAINADPLAGIHIANRNIVVTSMQPVFAAADSRCDSVRIRFQEVHGQNGPLKLYSQRKILSATKESFANESIRELAVESTQGQSENWWSCQFDCGAFDFFQLLLNFQ